MMSLVALLVAAPFTLSSQSKVVIDGDSSLHKWSCTASVAQTSAELDTSLPQLVRALTVQIPVAGIECGNGTMNGKLRDALGADKHPIIEYRFSSAERIDGEGVRLRATGTLTVAGKSQPLIVPVDAALDTDGSAIAMGSVSFAMSQFGIEPPTAMLGVLTTADRVTIRFELRALPSRAPHASLP